MTDGPCSTLVPPRLEALLRRRDGGLDDELLAEARALGSGRAGECVAAILDGERAHPTDDATAIRAAHLAAELGLAAAVPALVRWLEVPHEPHPVEEVAAAALPRFGAAAVEALLAALERSDPSVDRARMAGVMARVPVDDERIRAALVRMLDDEPETGARLLAERGEWRALPDLVRCFDRIVVDPVGDCAICATENLRSVGVAVRRLGGRLSDTQSAALDSMLAHADAQWIRLDDELHVPPPLPRAAREARPGRNDPCHCGSGRKYKKCHLEEDERGATH
jgi:hypothetical protein